ncbi:MAG: PAS domain-containing protein [Actinobacteria bacterium]|nr:PAS domain-containing protein [Actinomycetota bacterium]
MAPTKAFLRRYLMWIYAAGAAALLGTYLGYQIGTLYLIGGTLSLGAIVVGVIVNRPANRLPWLLLAGGTLLWVVGDFAWFSYGVSGPETYPSIVDFFYLLGYPVIAVSLALLLHNGSRSGGTAILDAVTITAGAGVLLYMRGLAPYFDGESLGATTVSVIYVLMDLVLVGLAARMVLTGTRRSVSAALLSVGFIALVLSDLFSYIFTYDSDVFWRLLDGGWLISYFSIGAAALHPSMARERTKVVLRRRDPSVVPFFVIAGGGLIAPLVLLPHVIDHGDVDLIGPLIGGVIFFFLTLLRLHGVVQRLKSVNHALAVQGEQLKEAEGLYRDLVEQTPAVSYVVAFGNGIHVRYISPQVREVLGYEPEEIVGDAEAWMATVHPDDLPHLFDSVTTDAHGRRSKTFRFVHKDGSVVWASSRISLIKDGPEEQLWQGISFDISDTHRIQELESALQREKEAVAKLRALDAMKNTFLQAVSHELRTPLTSIKGLAATVTVRMDDLSKDDLSDLVGRISANADRLEALLRDLLDVDRLSRGVFVVKQGDANVGSIVERVARGLGLPASQKITIDCEPVSIWTDASKVERIIENLVSNAIRHTPEDCSIWVTVRSEPGGVQIVVEDSGRGIDDDVKSLIFEPFGQWDSERGHSQGLGLGLSLVRRFSELLGGRAWVEDRPGSGASFNVFLPTQSALKELEDSTQSA